MVRIDEASAYPEYRDEHGAEFTESEQREIHANILAERYAANEIHCCQSSLVDSLIADDRAGFTADDVEGIYRDFSESTLRECSEYLEDNGYTGDAPDVNPFKMKREELIEALLGAGIDDMDDDPIESLRDAVIRQMDNGAIDGLSGWRDIANDFASDNPNEAYEWWHVSPWLVSKLRGLGEIVIDSEFGQWWGRGCTGQSILADGTLQTIARNLLK
jgi:hypothetical protein